VKLRVDLLPHGGYLDTVLVVDILRATTTAVAYLERGAAACCSPAARRPRWPCAT